MRNDRSPKSGRALRLTGLFAALLVHGSAFGVPLSYFLPTDIEYDPRIPVPSATLGYEVGDWHVRHDQLVAYLRTLADASDRISFEEFGRTHEGRPLVVLTISSPSNLARLGEIREQHVRLTDRNRSREVEIRDAPAVCYLGYSIHGDEPSGANASMLVAYYLAAARGPEIEELLARTVVLLDPALNPDGLAHFGEWANAHRGRRPVADPSSREREAAWPGGRTNHYWFDLNRDWLLAEHPESQARLSLYHRWKPNVVADFHETSSANTFFFQPGVPSRKNPLTPQRNVELTHSLAAYHARALDLAGSLYFTEELYDDYYYGKGSTYPDIQGGVGILLEQATSAGQTIELAQGKLDFPFTIRNQFLVSLSTLRGVRDLREDLLAYQRDFFANVPVDASGWIFGDRDDRGRTAILAELLRRHDIEVYTLARSATVSGQSYEPGAAYVVPRGQPQSRLLEAMMERRTEFPDSVFYDVSTWTLPLAFGLPYGAVDDARSWMGERVDHALLQPGARLPEDRVELPYAFAFQWSEFYAPRALLHLAERGIRARVATRPFSAQTQQGTMDFDYGAIVIPTGIQTVGADVLWAEMYNVSKEDGIDVHAILTGLTPAGIDLGSPNLRPLAIPSIGLFVGDGISAQSAGSIWHLLDKKFDRPVSLLTLEPRTGAQLRRYTHLILAEGSYGRFGAAGVEALKRWVEEGGVLILIGSAVPWAIEQELIRGRLRQSPPSTGASRPRPYVEFTETRAAQRIAGAIVSARIDRSHPLGYGFTRAEIAMLRRSRSFLELDANPYGTVVRYTEAPVLSGFVPKTDLSLLAGSASVVAQRRGAGIAIGMMDEPDFRSVWYGTSKLLLNAICFGSVIERTGE
jgi:hypothetical protein